MLNQILSILGLEVEESSATRSNACGYVPCSCTTLYLLLLKWDRYIIGWKKGKDERKSTRNESLDVWTNYNLYILHAREEWRYIMSFAI